MRLEYICREEQHGVYVGFVHQDFAQCSVNSRKGFAGSSPTHVLGGSDRECNAITKV